MWINFYSQLEASSTEKYTETSSVLIFIQTTETKNIHKLICYKTTLHQEQHKNASKHVQAFDDCDPRCS